MSPAISSTAGHLLGRMDKLEKEISRLRRNEARGWEIQYVVPAGGVASYTISTIPQYARHVRFLIQARGSAAAFTRMMLVTINADGGANYNYQYLSGNAAIASTVETRGATAWTVGYIAAANATAKYTGVIDMVLYWYANAAVWQACFTSTNYVHWASTAGNRTIFTFGGDYMGNAPITSLTFAPASGNFDAGSVITMYGTG